MPSSFTYPSFYHHVSANGLFIHRTALWADREETEMFHDLVYRVYFLNTNTMLYSPWFSATKYCCIPWRQKSFHTKFRLDAVTRAKNLFYILVTPDIIIIFRRKKLFVLF